jgi:hypothetical protein
MGTWDKAAAEALKVLGKDAKIPDPPKAVVKAMSDFEKAHATFEKARDEIEASILDLQNHNSAVIHALEQNKSKLQKEDFGLKDGDQDKIKKAQDLLTGALDHIIEGWNDGNKGLDELDEHIILLGK